MSIFLKEVVCAQCEERFGLTAETEALLRRSSKGFCCPWGHSLSFPQGESKEDKLRREVNQLRQNKAYLEDQRREAEARAEHERRRANGYKGHATKITKRAKAGVCPCCNRSFENLRRHMATKHPQFTPIELEQAATVQ